MNINSTGIKKIMCNIMRKFMPLNLTNYMT